MLNSQDIAVGRSYVNETTNVAREVVEELRHHRIKYNAFDLTTGNLIPAAQICHKSRLARWADREANADELSRIHPFARTAWFEALPQQEVKGAELEVARAGIEQVVNQNTFHRW